MLLTACGWPTASNTQIAKARAFVADNRAGFLRSIDCPNADMAPIGWSSLSEAQRRSAVLTLAIYCEAETGTRQVRVTSENRLIAEHDGRKVTLH